MKVRTLSDTGERRFAVVLDPGEEAVSSLLKFAREHDVKAASFTGLGAFKDVTLGFFDLDAKEYHRNRIGEQVEVVSLVGNFASKDSDAALHPHICVATRDGRAFGGHLMEGHVRPTLEVIVSDEPTQLRRKSDPATGLALLSLQG